MTGSLLRTIPGGHSSRQTNRKNHDLHFLVGVCFVLIMAECATLIFVSAVAIDEDVSAESIFVFLGPESARRQELSEGMYICILVHVPRPLGLGDPIWRRRSAGGYRDVAMVSMIC